jgi:hypothetical protein
VWVWMCVGVWVWMCVGVWVWMCVGVDVCGCVWGGGGRGRGRAIVLDDAVPMCMWLLTYHFPCVALAYLWLLCECAIAVTGAAEGVVGASTTGAATTDTPDVIDINAPGVLGRV